MKRLIAILLMVACITIPTQTALASDTYINADYVVYIEEVCEEYENISPELVEALIEHESSGRANATSSHNCQGLMQINPRSNAELINELGVSNLYDPYQNILVGVVLLNRLYKKYGDVFAVLMCYNEGEYGTAVERAYAGNYSKYAKSIATRMDELKAIHDEERRIKEEEEFKQKRRKEFYGKLNGYDVVRPLHPDGEGGYEIGVCIRELQKRLGREDGQVIQGCIRD